MNPTDNNDRLPPALTKFMMQCMYSLLVNRLDFSPISVYFCVAKPCLPRGWFLALSSHTTPLYVTFQIAQLRLQVSCGPERKKPRRGEQASGALMRTRCGGSTICGGNTNLGRCVRSNGAMTLVNDGSFHSWGQADEPWNHPHRLFLCACNGMGFTIYSKLI